MAPRISWPRIRFHFTRNQGLLAGQFACLTLRYPFRIAESIKENSLRPFFYRPDLDRTKFMFIIASILAPTVKKNSYTNIIAKGEIGG